MRLTDERWDSLRISLSGNSHCNFSMARFVSYKLDRGERTMDRLQLSYETLMQRID
jgi:ribosome assembly protein YihI (activator of Der GTPase)